LFSSVFSIAGFYYLGIRPHVSKTFKGFRIGLIRFGKPVNELTNGIVLEATNQISRGIFANSKIVITEYSRQKAIGFIFNKGTSNS
jgi:hypothetical protein